MRLLLDTHILLNAAGAPEQLSGQGRALLEDVGNTLIYSVASLWKIARHAQQARDDFRVDGAALRRGLLKHGYQELAISGLHALAVRDLPAIHPDPFDRIIVAQAREDGLRLVTSNPLMARYPGTIDLI
jgi:PIN domain nuclease of toxin-antitoxin system